MMLVCWLMSGIGLLALLGIVLFGVWILRRSFPRSLGEVPDLFEFVLRHAPPSEQNLEQAARLVSEAHAEHLQRRNEFWTTYGQVVIAVLMVVVLSLLLLTKTISAEAGLPILSGISGFAIAKGVSAGRSVTAGGVGPHKPQ